MASEFSLDDVPEDLLDLLSPNPTPDEIAYVKIYMEDLGKENDFFRPAIEATPLFQVFSVTIHGPNHQESEIYGTIYVTNERGENFFIYCAEKDKPQVVLPNLPLNNSLLLLSGPDAAIQPVSGVTIKVDLRDRARNDAIVAKGDFVLEHIKKDYGEQDDLTFEGRDQYYAKMHYVVFPYAIIATVQVSFFLNDDKAVDEDNKPITVDVYGTLSACCLSNIGDDDFPFITLFDKPHHQPLKLCSGTQFLLSRSVVVLPAYAALKIQANLNIPIAEDTRVFGEKNEDAFARDTKDLPWEKGFIRVKVQWYNAYTQPYRETKPKEVAEILSSRE